MESSRPHRIISKRRGSVFPVSNPISGVINMSMRTDVSAGEGFFAPHPLYGGSHYAAVPFFIKTAAASAATSHDYLPLNVVYSQLFGSALAEPVGFNNSDGATGTAPHAWPFPIGSNALVPSTHSLWDYDLYRVLAVDHTLVFRNYSSTPVRVYWKLIKHASNITPDPAIEFGPLGNTSTTPGGYALPYLNDVQTFLVPGIGGGGSGVYSTTVRLPLRFGLAKVLRNAVEYYGKDENTSYKAFAYTRADGDSPGTLVSFMAIAKQAYANNQETANLNLYVEADMNWKVQLKKTETST